MSSLPLVFRLVLQGLKTGMYYLRTRSAAGAIKFTVDQQTLRKNAVEAVGTAEDKARRRHWQRLSLFPSDITPLNRNRSDIMNPKTLRI